MAEISIDTALRKLKNLKRNLDEPTYFFDIISKTTTAQARQIASQVLTVMKPRDADPITWQEQIERFLDLITSRLTTKPAIGILIEAGIPEDEAGYPAKQIDITDKDIERWMDYGQKDPKIGKRITPEDESQREAAKWRIRQALDSNDTAKYQGIKDALEAFIQKTAGMEFQQFFEPILEAWVNYYASNLPSKVPAYIRSVWRKG